MAALVVVDDLLLLPHHFMFFVSRRFIAQRSFVFLENVAYLLSAAMSHVMDYVLQDLFLPSVFSVLETLQQSLAQSAHLLDCQELTRRGLRVRWTTVTGHMVGVQAGFVSADAQASSCYKVNLSNLKVCRERVFLLATKGDFHFQELLLEFQLYLVVFFV